VSCPVEQITGYVDAALDDTARTEIEAHLAACESCRAQADAERALRRRLLGLLHPPLPTGIEERFRERLHRGTRVRLRRILVPLALAALLAFVWVRRQPQVVGWEMARDHRHCFGKRELPAKVWSEDAETVMRWFEDQGTRMPVVPEAAGGYAIVGARYCGFMDFSRAAHLYYRGEEKKAVSLFVLPRTLSERGPSLMVAGQHVVRISRVGDVTVGIVAEDKGDVDAFAHTFERSVASASSSP